MPRKGHLSISLLTNGDSWSTQLYPGLRGAEIRMRSDWGRSTLLRSGWEAELGSRKPRPPSSFQLPPQQTTQLWDSHLPGPCLWSSLTQDVPSSLSCPPPGHPFLHLPSPLQDSVARPRKAVGLSDAPWWKQKVQRSHSSGFRPLGRFPPLDYAKSRYYSTHQGVEMATPCAPPGSHCVRGRPLGEIGKPVTDWVQLSPGDLCEDEAQVSTHGHSRLQVTHPQSEA